MARIRTIKPDFWTDEKVVQLTAFARLLFVGLWNFADDDGRMVYSPTRIKLQILPADTLDVSELIGEIRREKLVTMYVVDGVEYLQVNNFGKHQKVDKRTPSKLPAPPESPAESPRNVPTEVEVEGKGKELSAVPAGKVKHPIWDEAITALTESGVKWDHARSFVGKLLKDYEDGYVADALHESRGTRDVCAYVTKLLAGKPKRLGKPDPLAGVV